MMDGGRGRYAAGMYVPWMYAPGWYAARMRSQGVDGPNARNDVDVPYSFYSVMKVEINPGRAVTEF